MTIRHAASRLQKALFLAVLTVALPLAQAAELKEKIPNRLTHELVMQIDVQLGPREDMGKGPDGQRINYPIIGGTFNGQGMQGSVVPGGADMSVTREDGVTLINALYRLKTDDGQIIIIDNGGIWRLNESGLAKKAKGLELRDMKESDFYCRTSPRFRTQPGAHAWLNDYVFVGTIDGVSEHEVLISVYKVGGA
ncbi:DUF3237 domain-containing protein [Pseudomonas sp. BGr12]|uniref:DUF3237 domain-containing protein n=1 Tax=unclassified Pseudomonas TaxID=196821 RepID=UPI0009DA21EE|nr:MULTISPECIES: DUF3237 domain-containing protein [unclassified Pseudomonas]OQR33101.1 hypothetical protein BWR15_16765 [Pseudomonas sp. T]MBD9505026.1 DUF3237 domain-containing protein [Pseudomonas sp. PDM17]MBD9518169.1 DUF3237 domain-containing protein [Pseudomonas sp. PDM22]MBD9578377.1 DUF3237 domain-containing protein [Pseudomonas sp. PDM23]MBD9631594.1 DUF3237 domain-containing protein [Pseudomonas sp. PDM19]